MEHRSARMSDTEKIAKFKGILGAPVGTNSPLNEAETAMYVRIKNMLINTPGHAKYFGTKIKESGLDPNRGKWFSYLQYLPSPETVGVLGVLLADEGGRPTPAELQNLSVDELMWSRPNSDRAVGIFKKLLENPPVQKSYIYHRDLETWRLWFERVKAGKQTFRFVGDTTEYSIQGPVKKIRGEKRSSDSQIRPVLREKRSSGIVPVPKEAEKRGLPIGVFSTVLIVVLLLLSLCCFYYRKKTLSR